MGWGGRGEEREREREETRGRKQKDQIFNEIETHETPCRCVTSIDRYRYYGGRKAGSGAHLSGPLFAGLTSTSTLPFVASTILPRGANIFTVCGQFKERMKKKEKKEKKEEKKGMADGSAFGQGDDDDY